MLIIFFVFFSSILNAQDNGAPFEKWINSKAIKVACTGEINDHFIFSINLKDLNQAHEFLVMTGLYPETCVLMRNKVKKILKTNKLVLVSGFAGTFDDSGKVLVHQWKLVRGKNSCFSYWTNDCQK
jgi:hypothetical protein